ncbi:unnamed protein product [Peronospora belbahrii]|uniref:Serine protease n=1 Tax=Peronospora belbahrii TaxID=622444 RepID=A0ABN8D6M0_9STRA|nr:unnamed protein product [Peronospora belbahrii]
MAILMLLFIVFTALQAVMGIEYTDKGVAVVGTTESLNVDVTAGVSREDLIAYELASYIAVHFTKFSLPDEDSVVISSININFTLSHTYTGQGRDSSGAFIASFIPGSSVTVTYKPVGVAAVGQGYRITGFSRGYPRLGCRGKLVATTSTYITGSDDIDYAVVQLPACTDLSPYGYLQLRESGPVVNESIYVPQHPDGYAKRIVSTVDAGDDTTIRSIGEDVDCGTDQVGYDADTKGGSSGSPLIASSDSLVVAIHHCGECMNTAIDVRTVLIDLAEKNITIKNLVPAEDMGQSSQPLYAQTSCTTKFRKNVTCTGQNQNTMMCGHTRKQGSVDTSLATTTSNNMTITTDASTATASDTLSAAVVASNVTSFPTLATATSLHTLLPLAKALALPTFTKASSTSTTTAATLRVTTVLTSV